MNTLTKEWLLKTIAELEEERDAVPGIVNEDAAMSLAAMKIALASLEAEAVCVIDQSNLDYLKSGSDADVWPASRAEMGDVLLYRSAPPVPVSVPDEVNVLLNHLEDVLPDDAFNLIDVKTWNNVSMLSRSDVYRAAMLQGAEPVTTANKLRDAVETIRNSGIEIDAEKIFAERDALNAPDCWCRTCRPITLTDMRFVVCPDCGNKRCPRANDHRNACTGSNDPGQEGSAYPAAPQQEVK
ncbi:Uncharacterised protein [Enterobacter hormaechei]|jgi:Zn finger protein HypA/HybF involved in hydrogenase expression|nr:MULTISPECIES: hypothetical protein [Enterobacter cloacae complex]AVF16215.1 hydrogenase/urease nickel incorporation protein HypA [Enterobacter cloacae complex sp.]QLV53926.1 hypothetical protein HV223_05710 [Enterobacter cloacae]EHE7792188.1 hypothetical protein [Enterobacter hormaechei]ELC6405234.1 hypothetical protein [Enterobacter hormaechei]ELH2048324.1 hypothetical protein [Enterobacter hormaechei]